LPTALRDQFEKKVLKFTSQDIDDHIHGLMEWLISKNDRESKAIFEYVAHHTGSSDRNSEHIAPPIVGEVSMVFDENRRTILKRMIDQSRQTVRGYNIDQESQNLVTAVQQVESVVLCSIDFVQCSQLRAKLVFTHVHGRPLQQLLWWRPVLLGYVDILVATLQLHCWYGLSCDGGGSRLVPS